jgi:hypothetical protein
MVESGGCQRGREGLKRPIHGAFSSATRQTWKDHRGGSGRGRALALEPESGEALFLRHTCKGELGDEAGAREDFLRAGELEWPDAMEEILRKELA